MKKKENREQLIDELSELFALNCHYYCEYIDKRCVIDSSAEVILKRLRASEIKRNLIINSFSKYLSKEEAKRMIKEVLHGGEK